MRNSRVLFVALVFMVLMGMALSYTGLAPLPSAELKSVHTISMTSSKFGQKLICTAFAIGPHALFTDNHCELPTDIVSVDGRKAIIVSIVRDGNEHSILLLSGVLFNSYCNLDFRLPRLHEKVYVWGRPGGLPMLYREGYYMGMIDDDEDGLSYYFDLTVLPGDSGSPIFDSQNNVIMVVSANIGPKHEFAVAFPVLFNKAQLMRAKNF